MAVIVHFALVAAATADPVVALGTYDFDTGLIQQAIPIYAYNNPASGPMNPGNGQRGVQGLDLNVAIADEAGHAANGGPVFHLGTPGAPGTAISSSKQSSGYVAGTSEATAKQGANVLAGTIFAGHSNLFGPADAQLSSSQFVYVGIVTTDGASLPISLVPGVSLIATLYIDTVGVAPGTNWALKVGGENVRPGVFGADGSDPSFGLLDFADYGGFNTALVDGVIHINNAVDGKTSVPEPSTIALAFLGLVGAIAWGWRRRKRA